MIDYRVEVRLQSPHSLAVGCIAREHVQVVGRVGQIAAWPDRLLSRAQAPVGGNNGRDGRGNGDRIVAHQREASCRDAQRVHGIDSRGCTFS